MTNGARDSFEYGNRDPMNSVAVRFIIKVIFKEHRRPCEYDVEPVCPLSAVHSVPSFDAGILIHLCEKFFGIKVGLVLERLMGAFK